VVICIFTHTVYGFSGNELPPRPETVTSYIERSSNGETIDVFRNRMQFAGIELREIIKNKPVRPYSEKDSVDWKILEEHPVDELFETLK